MCAASTEPLNEKQAAVLAVPNPMWTKPKFQGNPLVEEGFARLGSGISELKFLFLLFGLAEKCFFSRNSLIPLSLHAGRSGGHGWEAGVADAGEVLGGDEEGGWERAGLLRRGSATAQHLPQGGGCGGQGQPGMLQRHWQPVPLLQVLL